MDGSGPQSAPPGKYATFSLLGPLAFPIKPITFGFGAGSIAVKNASAATLYLDPAGPKTLDAQQIIPPLTHDHVRNFSAGQIYVNGTRALGAGEYVTFQVGSAVEPMPAAALIPNIITPSDGMPNPAAQATVAYNAVYDPVSGLWVRWRQADPVGGNILTGVAAVGSYHFDSAVGSWVPDQGSRPADLPTARPLATSTYADTGDAASVAPLRQLVVGTSIQLDRRDADRSLLAAEPGHWRIGGVAVAGAASAYETGPDFLDRLYVARAVYAACLQTAAGATTATTLFVRDGGAGSGAVLFAAPIRQTGVAGEIDRVMLAPTGLTGSPSNRMSIEAGALPQGQVYLHLEGYMATL